jgi:NAD(P)-dependent dehydrogenase (short-subunit alcohol dehydrogenase family)
MFEHPRVVIVTGSGGTGCGRAIAARFAADGAAVVVSDINEGGGQETVRLIEQRGGRVAFCRADVADELQVRRLIEFAESTFGGLSVLVNNASSPHPAGEGMAGWTPSLQTDLLGTIYATRYAIDAMRRFGAVQSSTYPPFPRSGMGEKRPVASRVMTSPNRLLSV